jgi:catechol 1,2-dioxygenase
VYDDFAYATRDGLVPPLTEHTDPARIAAENLDGPFAEIVFDISLTPLVDGKDNQIVNRPRLAA